MPEIEDSILNTVKKALGILPEYEAFDIDIVMHINSVFDTLSQLGIHSETGFSIINAEQTWDQYLPHEKLLNSVKSYIYLKVRLLFDPPTTSFAIESFSKQIQEYEFRINVQAEELNPPELMNGGYNGF